MEKDRIMMNYKEWAKENKICFVTNSITEKPYSLFLSSLKTYIDYIPDNSFITINGLNTDGTRNYGLSAFIQMLNDIAHGDYYDFDYAIYIDEDCFIKNFGALTVEFDKFKNGNYCIGGLQDGGMICHRNQSHLMINTFLSFWNLKAIREHWQSFFNVYSVLSQNNIPYKTFISTLKVHTNDLYKDICSKALQMIEKGKLYRKNNFKQEPPHATVVRNDPTNNYEPNQIPYSYKENLEANMEPYYLVEEAVVLATKMPIYYFYGSDLYVNDEENVLNIDNSGITTVVFGENGEHIAYHTWFARYYNPFDKSHQLIMHHTERINSVLKIV